MHHQEHKHVTSYNPHLKSFWTHESGCPRLFLAPMEGVGDVPFRKAMAFLGGFDEACTEFIRVPKNAHVPSLSKVYFPDDTFPIPQAAQIMGDDCLLMAEMAQALVKRGAPRIDINCGCPSNVVVGRGAGSSLLKTPDLLHTIAKTIVQTCPTVPVTIKMRSGFQDTSLFHENLRAAEESGIAFLTLHPRTRMDGYSGKANWDLIRIAKETLNIPVIGSGDVTTRELAKKMKDETGCDGVMIGRGAAANPWIFHEIKALYEGKPSPKTYQGTINYLRLLHTTLQDRNYPPKTQINKLKQLVAFLFSNEDALHIKGALLTKIYPDPAIFREEIEEMLNFLHK